MKQIVNDYYEDKKNSYDEEDAHRDADKVLCDLLLAIGCEKTVRAWGEVPKWYS